jgi:hypothetical protein
LTKLLLFDRILSEINNKGEHNMKANTYYLFDNDKKVAYSKSFERVLNKTTDTVDGKIYYNNVLIWVQNPTRH